MDLTTLSSLSGEALTEALALDFSALDVAALETALTERKAYVQAALDKGAKAAEDKDAEQVTIAEVNAAEAVFTSIGLIEAEKQKREDEAKDAGNRFAAMRDAFSADDGDGADAGADEGADDGADAGADDGADGGDGADAGADDGADGGDGADAGDGDGADGGDGGDAGAVTTASGRGNAAAKIPASRRVGAQTQRPNAAKSVPVTMTAAAGVTGFGAGQTLKDMDEVRRALQATLKGFPSFNLQSAKAIRSANGGRGHVSKVASASFGLSFPETLVASGKGDAEYGTVKYAIEEHKKHVLAAINKGQAISQAALTAAGWCAPSPIAYNYIADYVVDGIATVPEVSAPRGGLMVTTGPVRSSQGTALDDFGWTQTETEADNRTAKTFETIDCPDFVDHRLDAIGYGFTIPILTQKAYPEIVTDALRFADVLYAHKANRRVISDMVGLSDAVAFSGYGPSIADTLEALSLIAVAERRKWNIGENAVLEVKIPLWVKEVFRADMSRRAAVAFDSVNDAVIAKHFSDRRLAVEYVADWQETSITNGAMLLPGTFTVLIYPSGTFVKAVEDVINLSATYDAASLTFNEYLGAFFEQGYMLFKAGYRSSKVTIPVNTAGEMGALTLNGMGDSLAGGSF